MYFHLSNSLCFALKVLQVFLGLDFCKPSWMYMTPPAGGSQTSSVTGSSYWSCVNMSLTSLSSSSFISHKAVFSPPLYYSPYTPQSVKLFHTTFTGLIFEPQSELEFNSKFCWEQWWWFDWRRNPAPSTPTPISLCGPLVNIVESPLYLGTIITQKLQWEQKISSLTKKTQQRIPRQLKVFNLSKSIMAHFYTAVI